MKMSGYLKDEVWRHNRLPMKLKAILALASVSNLSSFINANAILSHITEQPFAIIKFLSYTHVT